MKQTWFRPPAYRQFSLDADATDAPNRPDGTAARRLDGNPPTQDSMRGQAPAQPGAGQAEQHGLERIASERQEQRAAEQSTPDQCAQPAIKQLATEQQDQRTAVQPTISTRQAAICLSCASDTMRSPTRHTFRPDADNWRVINSWPSSALTPSSASCA